LDGSDTDTGDRFAQNARIISRIEFEIEIEELTNLLKPKRGLGIPEPPQDSINSFVDVLNSTRSKEFILSQ
jgi:hypothetical protein